MPDVTRALLDKKASREISIRALRLGIPKKRLLALLAIAPEEVIAEMAGKYLTRTKRGAAE